MAKKTASKGIGGWLGRQVGHIRAAVKRTVPPAQIYRKQQVREQQIAPNVTARRTVVDEIIVVQPEEGAAPHPSDRSASAGQGRRESA